VTDTAAGPAELDGVRDPKLRRLWAFLRVCLVLAGIGGAKLLVRRLGWEVLAPNPLFPALVASEVVLLGFLLNGVLLDYKEGETMPAELAAAMECLASEVRGVQVLHPEAEIRPALAALTAFSEALLGWMRDGGGVALLLDQLDALQQLIEQLRVWNPAPLQARLLLELAMIRRHVHRIEVIRETTFVPSVYGMAYLGTGLLTVGLVLTDIEPFSESMFFIGVISFLLIKLLYLITDLDNPFAAGDELSVENVSLMPLALALRRLRGGKGVG
jgi:hypothetical protein